MTGKWLPCIMAIGSPSDSPIASAESSREIRRLNYRICLYVLVKICILRRLDSFTRERAGFPPHGKPLRSCYFDSIHADFLKERSATGGGASSSGLLRIASALMLPISSARSRASSSL